VGLGDLVSSGTLGLLDAIDRYDPRHATLFSTYARFRIRGTILDQLRRLDWVPRSLRDKATVVDRAARSLEARLGRPPSEEELARALGLSLAAYRALRGRLAPVESVDHSGIGDGDHAPPFDRAEPGPLAALLRRERLCLVVEAIRQLPERDQLLLSLYYRDDLTMKEVGAVLGLTESRVSQLHSQALRRLRGQLAELSPEARSTLARAG
jgi:RNA polymerase sigma factor for flagellar operon FliA